MDWGGPINVKLDPGVSPWVRALWFFAHYDCRVYLDATHYIDVGAGSLAAAQTIKHFAAAPAGSVGEIGRWCEFARCDVLASGEHLNGQLVNVAFNTSPVFAQLADHAGLGPRIAPAKPISIGSGVVISLGAIVLPGAAIGDGALIAAGAVVKAPVEPFTIVGGTPAKLLSCRSPAAAWWDLGPSFMAANMGRLQDLAADLGEAPLRPLRPRLALGLDGAVRGFTAGDCVASLSAAPAKMQSYVAQAMGSGPHYWLADAWA